MALTVAPVCASVVRVPSFRLQFSASCVEPLAARFAYADDAEAQQTGAAARERGHYTGDEFLLVCEWKTARSKSKVADNSPEAVHNRTAEALGSTDEAARMETLLRLSGIGVPTASALLHFAHPRDYPILDASPGVARLSLAQRVPRPLLA